MDKRIQKLLLKSSFFLLSLCIAWYLLKSGVLNNLVSSILPIKFLADFIAGALYASFLTTPIALAMLIILSPSNNPIIIALIGGIGASLVDLLLVKFLRNEKKEVNLVSHELHLERINKFLAKWNLQFITPFLGAIIIISPFPDELGLLLMGASKLKYSQVAVITYILNVIAILLITIPANLLI